MHESVLASGDLETGVSIHLVNAEYDRGAVIAQCPVAVLNGDTPATLQGRVLARENEFLVETLSMIVAAPDDPSDVSQSPAPSLVAKGEEFSVASEAVESTLRRLTT